MESNIEADNLFIQFVGCCFFFVFIISMGYKFVSIDFFRELHLEKKIEQLTTEAKAKMAKKDKKGV